MKVVLDGRSYNNADIYRSLFHASMQLNVYIRFKLENPRAGLVSVWAVWDRVPLWCNKTTAENCHARVPFEQDGTFHDSVLNASRRSLKRNAYGFFPDFYYGSKLCWSPRLVSRRAHREQEIKLCNFFKIVTTRHVQKKSIAKTVHLSIVSFKIWRLKQSYYLQ